MKLTHITQCNGVPYTYLVPGWDPAIVDDYGNLLPRRSNMWLPTDPAIIMQDPEQVWPSADLWGTLANLSP